MGNIFPGGLVCNLEMLISLERAVVETHQVCAQLVLFHEFNPSQGPSASEYPALRYWRFRMELFSDRFVSVTPVRHNNSNSPAWENIYLLTDIRRIFWMPVLRSLINQFSTVSNWSDHNIIVNNRKEKPAPTLTWDRVRCLCWQGS